MQFMITSQAPVGSYNEWRSRCSLFKLVSSFTSKGLFLVDNVIFPILPQQKVWSCSCISKLVRNSFIEWAWKINSRELVNVSFDQMFQWTQLTGPNWSHLSLLLLSGVDHRGAAHLCQLAALTVKGPAADFIPNNIFDEEDAAIEAEWQPVEQLNVL